ncbi:MAG: anthranilate phosphoribosyltransferase, partial [Acidobacteria bacterium]|nr:anthranilate phosphoribosyltransferase [Acidobacteriota bacterium]
VFDTCGTGGDRQRTLNVSSLAALVLAACGVRVAKHGNRSVSSACGSADLFEALGVDVAAPPETVERCLEDVGMAFFFARTFHPSMRHAAPIRGELGIRTVFNLLGPLTNPAGASRQVVGVSAPEQTDLIAQVLARLGSEHAWVVHGVDGVDEVSAGGHTKVSECRAGEVRTFYVHPSDFGVEPAPLDAIRVKDVDESAALARDVLGGAAGPASDFVVVNAAAGLLVAGKAASLRDGARMARTALGDGVAPRMLDLLAAARLGRQKARGSVGGDCGGDPPRGGVP